MKNEDVEKLGKVQEENSFWIRRVVQTPIKSLLKNKIKSRISERVLYPYRVMAERNMMEV